MTGLLKALPKIILLGTITTLLAGCGEGLGDLRQFAQSIRAQPPGRIEPIPEFQPYQNFILLLTLFMGVSSRYSISATADERSI